MSKDIVPVAIRAMTSFLLGLGLLAVYITLPILLGVHRDNIAFWLLLYALFIVTIFVLEAMSKFTLMIWLVYTPIFLWHFFWFTNLEQGSPIYYLLLAHQIAALLSMGALYLLRSWMKNRSDKLP